LTGPSLAISVPLVSGTESWRALVAVPLLGSLEAMGVFVRSAGWNTEGAERPRSYRRLWLTTACARTGSEFDDSADFDIRATQWNGDAGRAIRRQHVQR